MNRPILSVIIPYYNGEVFIEKTVKSVLQSTLRDLELLLIDDGSLSTSGSVCDYLARKYENVHTIHKENGGIADARNRGIQEAKGKYIAFVDQDDSIDSSMYLSLISILEQYECDFVSSNFYVTDVSTGNRKKADIISKDKLLHNEGIKELRKWLIMGEVMPVPEIRIPPNIWNCVFSSDLVKRNNIRFESYIRYDDDWVFLLRCLAYSNSLFLCKQAYYNWMVHGASESHTAKYMPDILKRYEKLKKFKLEYIKNWCSVTNEEVDSFVAYFNANVVYVTIYNESVSNNKKAISCQEIRTVVHRNKSKHIAKEIERRAIDALINKKGNRAGVIYKLAVHHFYYLALAICRIKVSGKS